MASQLNFHETRGRTPSRGREDWSEPVSVPVQVLRRYGRERNPGLATDEQLMAIGDRLSMPARSEVQPSELEGNTEQGWTPDRKVMPSYLRPSTTPLPNAPPPYGHPSENSHQNTITRKPPSQTIHEMEGSTLTKVQASGAYTHTRRSSGRKALQTGDSSQQRQKESPDLYGPG